MQKAWKILFHTEEFSFDKIIQFKKTFILIKPSHVKSILDVSTIHRGKLTGRNSSAEKHAELNEAGREVKNKIQ